MSTLLQGQEPTAQLRYVDRYEESPGPMAGTVIRQTSRILQQRWRISIYDERNVYFTVTFEWRDVPIEKEE